MATVDSEVHGIPHGGLLAGVKEIEVHFVASLLPEESHRLQVVKVLDRAAQATNMDYLLEVAPGRTTVPRIVLVNQLLDKLDELGLVLRRRIHREQLLQHILIGANALWG